ncbi:MAG: hypothetical protein MJA31_05745 [Clostridia bacterium]|nr:hypothetical protein [Clostridia bacterium]
MSMEYVISGGQIHFDKKVFAREILKPNSLLKKIIGSRDDDKDNKLPAVTKTENHVTIYYNDASDIVLDDNFIEQFKSLKSKYKEKIKGRITIRMVLYHSYYMVLNFNGDNDFEIMSY